MCKHSKKNAHEENIVQGSKKFDSELK
jgi:hypothetical protein